MKKKIVCLLLAGIMCAAQVTTAVAMTEEELIEDQAWTSAQLDATYAQIDALYSAKAQLQNEISALDANLVNILVSIDTLKGDIVKKEEDIQKTAEDLVKAENARDKQYDAMKKRIQYIYENGGNDAWFQMMVGAENLSDLLTKAENAQKMYSYDRAALDKYVATVEQVTQLGEQYKQEKADLENMEQELEGESVNLQYQIEDKKSQSADFDNEIAYAYSVAADYEAIIAQEQAQIEQLEADRIAAEEAARAEAEAAAAEYDAYEDVDGEPIVDYTYDEDGNIMYDEDGDPIYQILGYESTGNSDAGETEEIVDYARDEDGDIIYDEDGDPVYETFTPTTDSDSSQSSASESSSSSSSSSSSGSSSYSSSGSSVVDYATQFVGNPYVWGGTSLTNGADCSGFVQSVYSQFGVSLPRTSYEQQNAGTEVSYADAQPGDLICYGGHVAIYMGDGKIVHASNARDGIKISDNAAYRTILSVRRLV